MPCGKSATAIPTMQACSVRSKQGFSPKIMAVFTEVSPAEAQTLLTRLNLGQLMALKGCASGIENTNYFVTTERGEFVLTLFERLSAQQLPYYLNLMQHLSQRGISVPAPQADGSGCILHSLNGKPAAVVTRLSGQNQMAPGINHVRQVGDMLARMHLAGQDYPAQQANLRGVLWWQTTMPQVLPHLVGDAQAMLQDEVAYQSANMQTTAWQQLPSGPIHADLFRDNVMFDGEVLGGFFDFYFAGNDTFVFDISVCLNDWCIDWATGQLNEAHAHAFVSAYDKVRPLSEAEMQSLPSALRAAALRFWISRLWDYYLPREASMLKPHDPTHFERVLHARRQAPWHYQRDHHGQSDTPTSLAS
jgi:homoserine kinase type II